MVYFKINSTDLSKYVASLIIKNSNNYVAQQNAAGDTVVDYINNKKQIEVEIIPLKETEFRTVLNAIVFNPTIYYRDPATGNLVSKNCIIDGNDIDYYTIRQNNVMYKKMILIFTEL